MSNDTITLDRLRNILKSRKIAWEEKKMFGGICFMIDDKMCFGTSDRGLLLRVDPDQEMAFRQRPGMSVMVHGGREMAGYRRAEQSAIDSDADLEFWIDECLTYNPKAKSSKKK